MTVFWIALGATWLILGLLHFALCMKDWRNERELRPHAWLYALAVFVPLVLFGPIGLYIRDWTHVRFPHWYDGSK